MKKNKIPNTRPEWARKIPRSSRICFRCEHKYSSHVPACGKIVERKPERKECTCRTFVKNQYELDLAERFESKEDRDRKIQRESKIIAEIKPQTQVIRKNAFNVKREIKV
jgi:hypothetical protein